ncbi:MAG: hypothetical protein JXA68_01325 [Ignavibacteriales bacterium]|nr:hypothetical protein [Ignavibacteriales bacterium]
MKLQNNFRLKCSACQHVHTFVPDDVLFESEPMNEGQMGTAYGHHWEHSFICGENGCTNKIEISYEVYEYPIGSCETDEIRIDGGIEIERFSYDFSEEPDINDLE